MIAFDTPIYRFYREFGSNLRDARQSAHLTQDQLARTVGLGRTSITNIERGDQPVALHVLFGLARAVDRRPCDLMPVGFPDGELDAAVDADLLGDEDEQIAKWARRVLQSG